jgi:CRP/FNR family cyclic AMP-dependent transcriptional regulator
VDEGGEGGAMKFDPDVYLETAGAIRHVREFGKRDAIFSQGQPADSVMYVQQGNVKLTTVNGRGKEAIVGLFGAGDFFGEGGMAGQPKRMGTATAVIPSTILIIKNSEMSRALLSQPMLSNRFIQYMLSRNIRVEADLVDQLFNSTEKRLARTLLLLARYGEEGQVVPMLQHMSQETLAEMVGTTRSRVSMFMNKFRRMGFIDYNGGIKIKKSLLTVVLHD